MTAPNPRMDAAQFDRIAATCRWSERSIGVTRSMLVDGVPVSEAAPAHQMSEKQARVLRGRFIEKAEKARLSAFMQREAPKLATSRLEPFAGEIRTLRDKGYNVDQIVTYCKENGITASATTVRKFLRSIRA